MATPYSTRCKLKMIGFLFLHITAQSLQPLAAMEFTKAELKEMEKLLPLINSKFVTLQKSDITHHSNVLKNVMNQLKNYMKEVDPFFKATAGQVIFSGSYYDGLKIGKPDEFDMNLVIKLLLNYNIDIEIENSPKPGYVKLKIKTAMDDLAKQPNWESRNKVTIDWLNSKKYLKHTIFRSWMESVVNKALIKLKADTGEQVLAVNGEKFKVSLTKSGPAMTIKLLSTKGTNIDIDFVPVLQFEMPKWPEGKSWRKMPESNKKEWYVVPKPLAKNSIEQNVEDISWRTSFTQQENFFIGNKNNLKTALRLMKKMRDTLAMKPIASYYIKTLFLWELAKPDQALWTKSLSLIVLTMLERLKEALQAKRIDYFWNKTYNLIGHLGNGVIENILRILSTKMDAIKKDKMKVVDLFLTAEEKLQLGLTQIKLSQ